MGAYEYGEDWVPGINWNPAIGPTGTGCYGLPGESCVGAKVDVSAVDIQQAATSIEVGDQILLSYNLLPSNATIKTVTWKSNNTNRITSYNVCYTKLLRKWPLV